MGFRNHFSGGTATASGLTLMDRLSHENGWTADTRKDYAMNGQNCTLRVGLVRAHG